MGNFHCIQNGCGRVVYREYLPPGIRYRYPGEDWITLDGDDYLIEEIYQLTSTSNNFATVSWSQIISGATSQTFRIYNTLPDSPPFEFFPVASDSSLTSGINLNLLRYDGIKSKLAVGFTHNDFNDFPIISSYAVSSFPGEDSMDELVCHLKIFKEGEIIHQETREECPEVELLDCRLSDIHQEIKIDKLPYLERIEVVPYIYTSYRQPGLGVPAPITQIEDIPPECLNVYNNFVGLIIPPEDALEDPDAQPFDSFIKQICSAPGCPPPEYEVYCDCDCESCPTGTCPIECDGHICCYNSQGKSELSIPIEDYCGEGN